MVPNVRISSSTLSKGGTGRLGCIPRILEEVNLKVEVTSLMKRILRACNWKLTVYEGGYATSDVEQPLQVLVPLLMMIVILAIGPGPRLLPMSAFRVIRIIIIGGEGRVRLTKVKAMMLWARL